MPAAMDLNATSLAAFWIASAGALGALLNAVATDNGHLLPRFPMPRSKLMAPGLLVNVLAGFVLCGLVSWVFLGRGGSAAAVGSPEMVVGVALGVLASRAIIGESDSRVLRAAACAAAAAPAADTDTIRTLAIAPPADVLRAAVALEPRKAFLRP